MYTCINNTYDFVKKDLGIDIVIRSGDIVEKAIETFGEHFHKDGFHLNDEGRYLVALGFVHTFNHNQRLNNFYIPDGYNEKQCQEYEELVIEVLKD